MRFGPWLPVDRAPAAAPPRPGVLEARAEGILAYPKGRSAMVLYAASPGGETLSSFVSTTTCRAALERAAAAGARLVRFAESDDPAAALEKLLCRFVERFGAPPLANEPLAVPFSVPLPVPLPVPSSLPHFVPPSGERMSDSPSKPSNPSAPQGLTYRQAGVDIDAGDELVDRIKSHVKRTLRPEVLTDLGGFAGLCALPSGYKEPVLVACTDGVGTKLKLAFLTGIHDTVGIDLVAMNVNDLVVSGAEPLFFLDYFAAGKLDVGVAERVIAGIADGCRQAGCALLGGETAELPGFYAAGEYDLAGFCVGVVERNERADGRTIAPGDPLLALGSSGFHSNGYSLVRRVFLDHAKLSLDARLDGVAEPLGRALLAPTKIYVRSIRALYKAGLLKGAAHITGGGLVDNPTRMLSRDARLKLQIDLSSWTLPPIFQHLQKLGGVGDEEMRRTFNCGVGMIVCVPQGREDEARSVLEREGETVFRIGQVAAAEAPDAPVEFLG